MRYALLLLGLTLVLAGCLGGPPATDVTGSPATNAESPTDDRTLTSTVSTTVPSDTTVTATDTPSCEEERVTTVDPVREAVTPSPLPDRPETLNESTAESFAQAFEEAYKRNTGLESDTTKYAVWTANATTTAVDGGYVVTMNAGYWYNAAEPMNGTTTPTVVHADGPEYRVAYFVGEDRVRRDRAARGESPDTRAGRIVQCWSRN